MRTVGIACLLALTLGNPSYAVFYERTDSKPLSSKSIIANPLIIQMKENQRTSSAFWAGLDLAVDQGLIAKDSRDHHDWVQVAVMVGNSKSINDACLIVEKDPEFGYRILRMGRDALKKAGSNVNSTPSQEI